MVIRIAKIRIGANPNIAIFPVKNGFGIEADGVFFSMDDGMVRYALPVLILCVIGFATLVRPGFDLPGQSCERRKQGANDCQRTIGFHRHDPVLGFSASARELAFEGLRRRIQEGVTIFHRRRPVR